MNLKNNKIHFPGLNGLRIIAALSVIIGHIERIKYDYGVFNYTDAIPFLRNTSGHIGVILFFVLSGFLITFLLLSEKENYGKVAIKKFYIRRILRIWPLYFLILLIVFLLFPIISRDPKSYAFFNSDQIIPSLILYVLFLPNLALQLGIWAPIGAHLWSIGVEEQFYIFWPLLVNFARKKILLILILIFVGVTFLPHFIDFIINNFTFNPSTYKFLKQFSLFFTIAKFNSMAVGGIMAWVYYSKKVTVLKILHNKATEVFVFVLAFYLWLSGFVPNYFGDELYSILFSIIILNVATNPNPIFRLKNNIFEYLGKISYGLYMYHWLAIVVIVYLIRTIQPLTELPKNALTYNLLIYPSAIALTIGLSSLSYEIYEKWFLNHKARFTKIKSG